MFQQIIVIGYLGDDPDSRATGSGTVVTNFSVATSERWKDKQSGEMQERTEWHRCVAWGRTAEIANEYLKKGNLVTVIGTLRTEKWQDKETGQDRYTTKLNVNELKLMPNGDRGGQREEREERPARSQKQSGGGARREDPPASRGKQSTQDDLDDDIPF